MNNKTSKISDLTIVCQQGTKSFTIGTIYNGLLLDRIEDKSLEYEDSITVIYRGMTEDDLIVFETINAPIVVEYTEIED